MANTYRVFLENKTGTHKAKLWGIVFQIPQESRVTRNEYSIILPIN